jgi:hypothetical protein
MRRLLRRHLFSFTFGFRIGFSISFGSYTLCFLVSDSFLSLCLVSVRASNPSCGKRLAPHRGFVSLILATFHFMYKRCRSSVLWPKAQPILVALPEHLPDLDTRPIRDPARPPELPRPPRTQKSIHDVPRLSRHPEIVTEDRLTHSRRTSPRSSNPEPRPPQNHRFTPLDHPARHHGLPDSIFPRNPYRYHHGRGRPRTS